MLFWIAHACFCTWVVFRGVPGINNVIVDAVHLLCEKAPKYFQKVAHRACLSVELTVASQQAVSGFFYGSYAPAEGSFWLGDNQRQIAVELE